MPHFLTCPVCRSDNVAALTLPHPTRSMTSEGRVSNHALAKCSCNLCGYGFHADSLSADDRDAFYDEAYDLGLRDIEADRHRAEAYARHIDAFLEMHTNHPRQGTSMVEFGCGTGALLSNLVERWSLARALGIEPATKLVRVARAHTSKNVAIREGFAEGTEPFVKRHDLCISVNVIEHALDPAGFLAVCKASIVDDGLILTICPDGDHPNSELLFRDHVSSFSVAALGLLAQQSGLQMIATAPLSGQQSGFRIFLMRSGKGTTTTGSDNGGPELSHARDRYLRGWREMEQVALTALGGRELAIFGTGEYADLLHAYCPELTEKATVYITDAPTQSERYGRAVISTADFTRPPGMTVLAAIHPRNWREVRQRFADISDRFVHPYQFSNLRSEL